MLHERVVDVIAYVAPREWVDDEVFISGDVEA